MKSYNCIFVHDLPCAIGSLVGWLVGAAVGDLDGLLEGGLLGLLEGLGVGLPMASINKVSMIRNVSDDQKVMTFYPER